MTYPQIRSSLKKLESPSNAKMALRFFKTGKGQYGEGDRFYGIRVPVVRNFAKQFEFASLKVCENLLEAPYHEERLLALLILVRQFKKGTSEEQKLIYDFYMNHLSRINNWDLVDTSAPGIVGAYLQNKDKAPLYELAKSTNLWEKRIAILATFHLIRNNEFQTTLKVSHILLNDPHDLIHKAVGWMLREVIKKDPKMGETFLKKHYKKMPRTMLRYAIEKLSIQRKTAYLKREKI